MTPHRPHRRTDRSTRRRTGPRGRPGHRPRARPDGGADRRLLLNPTSGSADHTERIRELAAERGYDVVETERADHAVELAAGAARDGVDLLGVAGGDGTVNEALRGLVEADALDDVTLGVVPTGTANLLATYVGVTGTEQAFELLDAGERRRVDLGLAGGRPFVVSCIAGLPADVSVRTSAEDKERLGSLAFLTTALREASDFDGLRLEVSGVARGEETTWSGEALCALVGNVRRFAGRGGQANAEDGLFEVVVVEQMPPVDLLAEATSHRLLGRDTDHVFEMRASQLRIESQDGSIEFSLDGERTTADALVLHARPQALRLCVGPTYDPAGGGD